jgi:outer membrane protein assembly factor BamA
MIRMRRVLVTPLVVWLFVALSDAKAQIRPSPRSTFVSVHSVTFEGADSIPASITSIARERILRSRFQESELVSASAARARQVLYAYGYLEALVEPPNVKRVESNSGLHSTTAVELVFRLEPGARYYVSGIAVGGTQAIAAQQVRDLIPFHPGDPDDQDKLDLALIDIRHLYACSGYLDANPDLLINSHRATQTEFFTVMMREGEQSIISRATVLGLDGGLVEKMITLPELQPNSVFSSCRIREAISSLWPSGTTSSNSPFAIKAVRQRGIRKVDVVINFSPIQAAGDEILEQTSMGR